MGCLEDVLSALKDEPKRLVIDLSCRRRGESWVVAMNKWQTLTDIEVTKGSTRVLRFYCLPSNQRCRNNPAS